MIKILLLFSLTLANSIAFSQNLGIFGGYNHSKVIFTDKDLEFGDFTSGFHLGLSWSYPFAKHISLRTELMLSRKGYTLRPNLGPNVLLISDRIQNNLTYISMPVMADIKLAKRISLFTGIELSYLLSEKVSPELPSSSDLYGNYRQFDFGMPLGIRFEVSEKMEVRIRYVCGLSNLRESNSSNDKLQNRVFQISFGYLLGKK